MYIKPYNYNSNLFCILLFISVHIILLLKNAIFNEKIYISVFSNDYLDSYFIELNN